MGKWHDLSLEAHKNNTSIPKIFHRTGVNKSPRQIHYEVTQAIPQWAKWPIELKQVFAALPLAGELGSICKLLEYDLDEIEGMIDTNPSFQHFYEMYIRQGEYPKTTANKRISHAQIETILMLEAAKIAAIRFPTALTPSQIMAVIKATDRVKTEPEEESEPEDEEGIAAASPFQRFERRAS